MRKFAFWAAMVTVPMLVALTGVEFVSQLYFAGKRPYEFHASLGWVPKAHFDYDDTRSDATGNEYRVTVSTDRHGFRAWGDTDALRSKVLFVGDSFTGDLNMSDADAYFGYVAGNLDAEVFAVGAGGYGTLQELMLLEQFAPTIKPDLLVVQFCSNDFANNSFALETNSIVRSQKNLRPYLVDDAIVYRLPRNHWYKRLYQHFSTFRFLDQRLQNVQYARYGGYNYPNPEGAIGETIRRQADATTESLLRMMIAATPSVTTHLSFQTCGISSRQGTERWMRVMTAAGFRPLPAVSNAVANAAKRGAAVFAADGAHWAPSGHRIAGAALVDALAALTVPKSR